MIRRTKAAKARRSRCSAGRACSRWAALSPTSGSSRNPFSRMLCKGAEQVSESESVGPNSRHCGRTARNAARGDFTFRADDVRSNRRARGPACRQSSCAQESRRRARNRRAHPLPKSSQQSRERRGSGDTYLCRPKQAHQGFDARTDSGPEKRDIHTMRAPTVALADLARPFFRFTPDEQSQKRGPYGLAE